MTQHAERARIIKHIRALSEQTVERGQSEAAANMAMDRIARLLTTFNLTMDEVMLGAEGCVQMSFGTGYTKRRPIAHVVSAIASFTDTRHWRVKDRTRVKLDAQGKPSYYRNANGSYRTHKVPGNTRYEFFGLESDVLMAIHLCGVIQDAIDYELARFKESDTYKNSSQKLSLTNSFGESMASRIGWRLGDMKREMTREQRDATPMGGELVVLKKHKIEEEFKKTGTKLVYSSFTSGTRFNSGSMAGHDAGSRVNLNRPVANGGRGQLLLG